ncbi:MAG: DnaK suppressor protein [Planctomycetota bacterium]|jgi:DnaK suppressor protein
MPGRKLNDKDLAAFKALLIRIRGVLVGDISKLEVDAFGVEGGRGGVDAAADGGSDRYMLEFSLELMQIDEHTLREIDSALERISAKSFGRCESCNQWILKDRLRAIPHALNCIDCQRAQEQS